MADINEFESRFKELFDYIYRYVACRIPDELDAEDLASSILTEVYHKFDRYDSAKGDLRQYITGVARNKIVDFWRSQKIVTVDIDEVVNQLVEYPIVDLSKSIDEASLVAKILETLPPTVQALFILHYIDGLTYEEIGNLVQRKPATIRKVFSDTHKLLREKFNPMIL